MSQYCPPRQSWHWSILTRPSTLEKVPAGQDCQSRPVPLGQKYPWGQRVWPDVELPGNNSVVREPCHDANMPMHYVEIF